MKRKLELLAPAGSLDSLKAAVCAGADAVYMGGSRFGARAYAKNPQGDELLHAIDYAHLHGVKLYLTINTLLKEQELEKELYHYLLPCYEHGLDAVIVQDTGVLSAARKWFPDLPIHASTQMTLCGMGGAKVLKEAGAQRIVLARELSLTEIARIHEHVGVEIECFVHGALCYCYSGQCLFSSILGGRSGNRGRCAQPCRLEYEALPDGKMAIKGGKGTLLSPKDICAVDLIPQIAKAGVYSLKIEGRMKRPEYTAGVVRIYRKYVDRYLNCGARGYQVDQKDREELSLLFNRDGFSRGYYEQHNGRNMMALANQKPSEEEKRRYEALIASLKKQYVDEEKKIPIEGCLYAEAGKPLCLELKTAETDGYVTVYGDCPQMPKNRLMETEQLKKQIQKTGNTPFVWDRLKIRMNGPLFVPVQSLNSLRRNALEQLETRLIHGKCRMAEHLPELIQDQEQRRTEAKESLAELHISVETLQQLDVVLSEADWLKQEEKAPLSAVYVDAECLEEALPDLIMQIHEKGLKAYVMLPAVFRMKTELRYEAHADFWKELSADGYVIRNLEEYEFLQRIQWKKEQILDHNVYTFNRRSRIWWRERGIVRLTNPLELNNRELKEISSRDSIQIIYGRYPMMTTAGCLHKTLNQCRREPEQWKLRDRYRKEFPVKNYCRDCYNVIYNSQPLYLLDQTEILKGLGAGACRMTFTTENEKEVRSVLNSWLEGCSPQTEFTRGHFKRGVE